MDVLTAIRGRRSIRKFLSRGIEPDKIEALKDALIWAPSAGNLQGRRFYFVYNEAVKKRISEAALNQRFIADAPLVVVGCADSDIESRYGDRGISLYCIQDVACALENMMLLAHSLGLGSVWVGAFHEEEVANVLALPGNLRPVAIVPVGHPAHTPSPPRRVTKEEAVKEVR